MRAVQLVAELGVMSTVPLDGVANSFTADTVFAEVDVTVSVLPLEVALVARLAPDTMCVSSLDSLKVVIAPVPELSMRSEPASPPPWVMMVFDEVRLEVLV